MLNTKELTSRLTRLQSLKILVETYEEIAANRMRKIRSSVLASRDFNLGLDTVYQKLKSSYWRKIQIIMHQTNRSNQKVSFIKRNGKTIAVFFSANTRLYGEIVQKTYHLFANYIRNIPCDIVILGRLGESFFTDEFPKKPYVYLDFPDTDVTTTHLSKLIELIIQYEKIYLFYGRFESLTHQLPTILDLYGKEDVSLKPDQMHVQYMFEPSLEQIMSFFESEIFASIVEQTVREQELAKYAARMVNLDQATENIKTSLKAIDLQKKIIKHRIENKKQTEILSGMSLWGGRP